MIQNLNPVSMQRFGSLVRNRGPQVDAYTHELALVSDQQELTLFRAASDTRVYLADGKSVLSLSNDGETFLHFYFDKPVCIKTNTYFYFSPFVGNATISLRADCAPQQLGTQPNVSLRMNRKSRVEGIYTFHYQEREQGFIFSGEEHPMPELTYVDQGEIHSVADGHDILLKQGDIAFWGPNQWHMHYADMGVAPRYVTITFDLEGVDITPLLNRKFVAPQQAVTLIQQMLKEQERMDEYSPDMILSYLSSLVLTILRHANEPGSKPKAATTIHMENETINRAQQYICANVRQKLSVPLVANKVGVSPSYLTALFHKNLQISPGEYIRRIKLQESKQMIRSGSMNFTEIAAALQYSTVHHFSRQFKEKFGITPSEYARSVR